MSNVLRFPPSGWCVRPGAARAHFLFLDGGRLASACGGRVRRPEMYAPQRLRPRQAGKGHCQSCAFELSRMSRSYGDAA